MASPISFSGLASGIDGDAIIKATLDARRLAEVPWQNKIKSDQAQVDALNEFSTKILGVHDSVQDFLTLAGSSVSKTATVSNQDAVGVVVGSSAVSGSTTVTVNQLARTATLSFADNFTSADAAVAPNLTSDQTLTLTVGSGSAQTTQSVTVNGQTTLSGLAYAINGSSNGTVRASVINVGTPDAPKYRLVLNTTTTGVNQGSLAVTPSQGLTDAGLFQVAQLDQAQDAVVNVQGLGTVSRPTNQVSDLIPGVTLNLKQQQTGPVVVSVSDDADKTASKIADFVQSLNDLIADSVKNSAITSVDGPNGKQNSFGSLARTRVDDNAITAIKRAIAGARSGIPGAQVQVLADLGLSVQKDGTYKFDSGKFTEAVASDPQAVDNVLHSMGDAIGATGGVTDQYTQYKGIIEQAVTGKQDEITRYNDQINRLEAVLSEQEKNMKMLFAHLEQSVAQLNKNGDAIAGIISGGSSSSKK